MYRTGLNYQFKTSFLIVDNKLHTSSITSTGTPSMIVFISQLKKSVSWKTIQQYETDWSTLSFIHERG